MTKRVFLYGVMVVHLLVLFPASVLPLNRYKLIDPDTTTPPDPDTVLVVYAAVVLFALSVAAVLALARGCRKLERNIVLSIVGLTSVIVIAARIFG